MAVRVGIDVDADVDVDVNVNVDVDVDVDAMSLTTRGRPTLPDSFLTRADPATALPTQVQRGSALRA